MKTYVTVLGIFHLLLAGLAALIASAPLFVARAIGVSYAFRPPIDAALSETEILAAASYDQTWLVFVAFCVLLFSLAEFITAVGLLRFRPWAWTLGIAVSIFDLLLVPFGTIFGIYSL